ncbi:TetR/AcrR family transcriptional regulator [Williamsia sp.]|uniref:TetR/AcrR family transcriptional regulator n=1 Tax=Williamsia sp. TaxID=1872085 RepID=UPI001A33EE3A|nr:TetR/AcrR family transcriptional regulator [Williamsia sp.]MBJ7288751.1 TetR/AcrR family transcriptional regulator [Williamsia sp.]
MRTENGSADAPGGAVPSVVTSPSTIATPKGRRTEKAFLAAARTVFADKGFLSAKISDIAETAGRSTGSFYNYYDNKQQLLEALLDDFTAQILERTRRNLTPDPGSNIEQAVRAYWATYRDYLPEMIGAFQLSMTDRQFAQWWRNRRQEGIRAVNEVFRSVERSGVDIGLDKNLFASAIVSMLESFCWTWFVAGKDENVVGRDDEAAIITLTEIWRRGLVTSASTDTN